MLPENSLASFGYPHSESGTFLLTSTFIGRYRLETRLGAGQWSETYQAYDLVNRRPVALKLLKPDLLSSERTWRGLLAEIQRAAELVHPHIAWIWETGEEEGRRFLTERFIAGVPLEKRLAEGGPLPWGQALPLLEQLAQALEFGSERGWLHGRITPHNLLVSAEMGSVLSDYGLANALRLFLPEQPPTLYNARFLAPEALQGEPLSKNSDGYALACLAVTMLRGSPPFAAETLDEMLERKRRISAGILLPASGFLPIESTPIPVGEVIARGLDPKPSLRYSGAAAFVEDLAEAIRLGLTDENLRLQHEEQLLRWRENEEKTRLEAEEVARLAAVAEARKEIHERARLEAEQIIELEDQLPVLQELSEAPPQQGGSRKTVQPSRQKRIKPVYLAALGLLALAILWLGGSWLGGAWLDERRSGGFPPVESPSSTAAEIKAIEPTLSAPSLTPNTQPSSTSSSTEPPTPTQTIHPASTNTPGATPSPSSTFTNTPPTPTPTAARPESDRERPGDSVP